jgi:putative radical SAM enzyme (TIGR03279 family)
VEIVSVLPDSLAAEAGLTPGLRVLAINGQTVRDFLDLHLWLGDEILDLDLAEPGPAPRAQRSIRIVREYGRPLGLKFRDPGIRHCANDCPFCFVDQLPEGLRKGLYYRDDDYRYSYLYGHFVTLTNLREDEFTRIIDQELTPLYVSVHALDPEVRNRLLVSERAGEIRARIEQLVAGGITLHTQIVAVPGINDGEVLRETIYGLAEYYPGVASVAVVPVGLTAHRADLPDMRTFTRAEARGVCAEVRRYGRAMHRRVGTTFCFVSDELLIHAGKPIPAASYYEGYPQRENGVGLVRGVMDLFAGAVPRGAELRARGVRRVWILTGESFAPVLADLLPALRARLPEITLEMIVVENRLFGRPTTVAGLLGGRDLLDAARPRIHPGDLVLVPDESINEDGVFIDDLAPADLARELRAEVVASWGPILGEPEGAEDDDVSEPRALVAGIS